MALILTQWVGITRYRVLRLSHLGAPQRKMETSAVLRDLHNDRKTDLNANGLLRWLENLQWLWQSGIT